MLDDIFFVFSHFLAAPLATILAYWLSIFVVSALNKRKINIVFCYIVSLSVYVLKSVVLWVVVLLISFKLYEFLSGQTIGDDPGPVGVVFIGVPILAITTLLGFVLLFRRIYSLDKSNTSPLD